MASALMKCSGAARRRIKVGDAPDRQICTHKWGFLWAFTPDFVRIKSSVPDFSSFIAFKAYWIIFFIHHYQQLQTMTHGHGSAANNGFMIGITAGPHACKQATCCPNQQYPTTLKTRRFRMADIHIEREHAMSLHDARAVACKWAEQARKKFAMECSYAEGPASDLVSFSSSGVQGSLAVTPSHFEIHITLGFLARAFKDKIQAEIVKNLDTLIQKNQASPKAPRKAGAHHKPA
jgi:putative polyhydroxyalkanoate system protein